MILGAWAMSKVKRLTLDSWVRAWYSRVTRFKMLLEGLSGNTSKTQFRSNEASN